MNTSVKDLRLDPVATSSPGTKSILARANVFFYFGCLLCGTWLLGPIGAPLLIYGLWLTRKAQLSGEAIRPWAITIVGGLILVDSSVNFLAWGMDMFPAHYSVLGRSLWINYGMIADGAYALNYNHNPVLGGTSNVTEKSIQISCCLLVMPIRIAAAWGLLHMKRWGLQWSILGNWLYFSMWILYCAAMSQQFDLRFSTTEFGVLGFWMMGGVPFLGPLVLLPFLHTVNRHCWTE